ncbi:MAG: helix-turn-helix domain-containing protein [Phocaeicola sp.]
MIRTQYDLTDYLVKRFDMTDVAPAGLTLILLSGYVGADWKCWPSYELLAQRSGQGVRSVKRHIKWLLELGIITLDKGRANGSPYDHNIYTFQIQRILGE